MKCILKTRTGGSKNLSREVLRYAQNDKVGLIPTYS